ncbi:uncharacterized protein PRCAT00003434001 [Priceomyces carsonii]|uniref:uncharacterized protein n=1 Tax=Priceomyces carsonii TaxID=28549 RepID=UPI002ED833FA|nr:unnamed protein product [Priceomyces carsonii]
MSDNQNGDSNGTLEARIITIKLRFSKKLELDEEVLKIPISISDTLADLKQSLAILQLTRNFTNYKIIYQNVDILNEFEELTTLLSVADQVGTQLSDEVDMTFVESSYNLALVYEHLIRFRESVGLHFLDRVALDFGVLAGTSSFNQLGLSYVKRRTDMMDKDNEKDEKNTAETPLPPIVLSDEEISELKEISSNIISQESISLNSYGHLESFNSILKVPFRLLTISQWSPVPAAFRFKGDLLYLMLQTLENETYHITCHRTGFYVNRCSSINFNRDPKLDQKSAMLENYTLYGLINKLSSSFSNVIRENELNLADSSLYPETYLLPTNSFVSNPWLVSQVEANLPDFSRSQLPLISNGVDGEGYIKEWNEDIQSIRELPKNTVEERILREKLLSKSLYEFNKIATKTAINIIEGNFAPMNPNDPENQHIFLRNGIFYSFPSNSSGAFDSSGGAAAARYTSSKDLSAIRILNRLDISGVSRLITCVVDFLGKRVICQAPVPGILSNTADDTSEKVSYGLMTDGVGIANDSSFVDGMKSVAEVFHLSPHKVQTSNEVVELLTSKDTKGIIGSDQRRYVMDLFRTAPLDIEFIEAHWKEGTENSYPHRETLVRHEAVEEWWKRRASVLFKEESERLEKEGKAVELKEGERPSIGLPVDHISFNPDAFTGIETSKEDELVVREISKFVKDNLIDEFLNEFPSQLAPFDGAHLSLTLHKYGINLRYLGLIATSALERKNKEEAALKDTIAKNDALLVQEAENPVDKKEGNESSKKSSEELNGMDKEENSKANFEPVVSNYDALYKLSVQEMISRAVKHLLRELTIKVPFDLIPNLIVHFHNCLLGSDINPVPEAEFDHGFETTESEALHFATLTSEKIFSMLASEVFIRFRFLLPSDWLYHIVEPLQLFREIALKFGIQWKSQNYHFTKEQFNAAEPIEKEEPKTISKKNKKGNSQVMEKRVKRKTTFLVDDLINFTPLIKKSTYRATIVDDIFESAKMFIVKGEKDLGVSYLNDLAAIYEQIYGRVDAETADYYITVSQMYAELGMTSEACDFARRAVILNERVNGFDSYEAISTYINAAYYEFLNQDLISSFKLYNKAITKWTLVYGEDHPSFVTTLTNLAGMLLEMKLHSNALKVLEKALEISKRINGRDSQLTGLIFYRIGTTLTSLSKFKDARESLKASNEIFTRVVGPEDFFSRESSKYVSNLTTYLNYMAYEEQKKKANQQLHSNSKTKTKGASKTSSKTKNNRKGTTVQLDPEIASKSIEEILAFIENKTPSKTKK